LERLEQTVWRVRKLEQIYWISHYSMQTWLVKLRLQTSINSQAQASPYWVQFWQKVAQTYKRSSNLENFNSIQRENTKWLWWICNESKIKFKSFKGIRDGSCSIVQLNHRLYGLKWKKFICLTFASNRQSHTTWNK
jgi:hypothetical protein